MRIDTEKKGIMAFFKPYQIYALEALEANQEDEGLGSRQVWEHVNMKLSEYGERVSRASVINFLEEMREAHFILGKDLTGKGGHRFNYKLYTVGMDHVSLAVCLEVAKKMKEAFPKVDLLKIFKYVEGDASE